MDLLTSIGFVCRTFDIKWDGMFQRLTTYKKQHGSTLVPRGYEADPELGIWVVNQRQMYRNKTLCTNRIKRPESIGFVWDALEVQWMKMYDRLVAYKKQHKSTQVPAAFAEDPHFGTWVYKQRAAYNKGKLSIKRQERLNSIDLAWEGKKGRPTLL